MTAKCPKCSTRTERLTDHELCHDKGCPIVRIERNNLGCTWGYNARGEQWVYNARGQCVQQPYPNSVAHLREGQRRADIHAKSVDRLPEYDPLDKPADHGARGFGNLNFGRRVVEEPESAA